MPLDLKVLPVFPTPLVVTSLPHVDNKALVDIIYSLRDAGLLKGGHGLGGLQTQGNIFKIDRKPIRQIAEAFAEMIGQMGVPTILQMVGWAVIGQPGDLSLDQPHNHLPYHFSAVYYPKVPKLVQPEGSVVFFDPRETFTGGQPVQLPPEQGMMVLFPSWLKHSVVPVRNATEDRISISLNAIIGTLSEAENYAPHRAKKRAPGAGGPPEFDPASPVEFGYPGER
ncbi:MAG: putative 2OG-Fe(II) oxygenase [Tepidisphaeraceae bacterium]